MYKNLNDYTATTLDVKFNNTNQLSDIERQVTSVINFSKYDLQLDNITGKKRLVIYDRIIKHCLIKCPDGQVWNTLDYQYGKIDNKVCTIFNFSYVEDDEWQDGIYCIYVGASDVRNTFSNAPSNHGVQILRSQVQQFYFKKLVAGNGTKLLSDKNNIIIQLSEHNYTSQPILLTKNTILDLKDGNLQLCYCAEDCTITDIINSTYDYIINCESDSSQSSSSYFQNNCIQQPIINITVIVDKPFQTTLKYKDLYILQRYDIGWFAFTIRKIFGKLFISQPTRMITDFEI